MAGLAAALNAPASIDAIAWALSARGSDGAVCRLAGPGDVPLDLAVRAAMPAITRVVAEGADEESEAASNAQPVAALVFDGIASVTALDGAYTERGPAGLVDEGEQPYAVVLADAQRGELVLARNGAGPTLYYARLDDGWVVASEPAALVHAGVEPEPDVAVVRRFIQTGDCDESERTFFARIRRVLPGEAIVLSTTVAGPVRHPIRWTPPAAPDPDDALWNAAAGARVAALVGPGIAGGAVLGAALHHPDRREPLQAFTATLGTVEPVDEQTVALVGQLPPSEVQHTALRASLDLSTLDRYLREMGEPIGDLGIYLLWTVAREFSGGVDTLMDSGTGTLAAWERVCDRMLAHFGVTVRAPLRCATPPDELVVSVLRRALPPRAAKHALEDPARRPTTAEIVLHLRDEVAAALVPPRPWSDGSASVTALRRLASGEAVDAEPLLRAFLVERWIAGLGAQVTVPEVAVIQPSVALPQIPLRTPDEVVVGADAWWRIPVRTAPIAEGDQLLANTAFYVANALAARSDEPIGPWFTVLSGKVVAVSQRRVNPVAGLRPGRAARLLCRLARRRWPQLATPHAMQVAIEHSGLFAILRAVLLRAPMPAQARVYPPRADAMAPAESAVVETPSQPDDVAASLVAAMRLALAPALGGQLVGVAVVSADDSGCRVLGYAQGPAAEEVPQPRTLLSLVLADNPAGQGMQRTPIVIVAQQTPAAVAGQLLRVDRHADLAIHSR